MFTDQKDQAVALHIRRGVAEFVPEPSTYLKKADYVLELDGKTWASVYLGSADMAEEIKSKMVKVTRSFSASQGEEAELIALFDIFDKLKQSLNFRIPLLGA